MSNRAFTGQPQNSALIIDGSDVSASNPVPMAPSASPTYKKYLLADITGAAGGSLDLSEHGAGFCREIHVHGGPGTLKSTPRTPISGDETIDVYDGEILPIEAIALKSSGTAGFTSITVFW